MIEISQTRAGISSAMSLSHEEHGRFSIQIKHLIKSVAALVNTEGGIVYIGVEEDGSVTGLQNVINGFYTIPDFISEIRKSFVSKFGSDYHKLISSIKVVTIEDKDVIEVVVKTRSCPLIIDNKLFSRKDKEIVEASGNALIAVLDKWVEGHTASAEVFYESEPSDSFRKSVEAAINKEKQKKANALKLELERKQKEELKALQKAQQEAKLQALRESLREKKNKEAEIRLNSSRTIGKTDSEEIGINKKVGTDSLQKKQTVSKEISVSKPIESKPSRPQRIVKLADDLMPIIHSLDFDRLKSHVVTGEGGKLHEYRAALEILLERGVSDPEYWMLLKILFSVDPIMFALIFVNSKQMAIDSTPETTKRSVELVINQLIKYNDKIHYAYSFAEIYKDYLSPVSVKVLSDNVSKLNDFETANSFFDNAFTKESEKIDALLSIGSKASLYKIYLMIKDALSSKNKKSILNNLRKIQDIIDRLDKQENYQIAIADLIRVDCLKIAPKFLSRQYIANVVDNGYKSLSSLSSHLPKSEKKNAVSNSAIQSSSDPQKPNYNKLVGKKLIFIVTKSLKNHYRAEYHKAVGLLPIKYSLRPNISNGERVEVFVVKAYDNILLLSYENKPAEEVESIPLYNNGDFITVHFLGKKDSFQAKAEGLLSLVNVQVDNMTENINLKEKYTAKVIACLDLFNYRVELLHPTKG